MRYVALVFLVGVLTALYCGCAEAHVMGIDFGSEFIKVAAPRSDHSVDIVLNELSKRKTDNYIGFRNGERYMGDQAKTLAARFPLLTAGAVNQLMGMQKGSPEASAFADMMYEYEIEFDDRQTARVPVKDAHGPFTAEELYAMFLSYSEQIAALDGVVNPQSAVVTIPFHASVAERRAILEAAQLSQIDILGFQHSTTAAAMYYGIRRRGFGDRNVTLVVFDIGTTHTEAGVYRFTPPEVRKGGPVSDAFGTITTVAVLEDKTLGGRAFDLCVARIIEKDAIATMGIQPVIGGRSPVQLKSQFSLLRSANKVREILSANTKTPLTVEGIEPERDFHSTITREAYETECAPLFARVKDLAKNVLLATGLKPKQIDAFEMMGGAARTPKIIADISSILGRDVDRTLNMDEAAAIGAAYYGVKLSPFYRVKSFKLNERVPFNISFTVDPPPRRVAKGIEAPVTQVKRVLFTNNDNIGSLASVSLNRTADFSLKLYEGSESAVPFAQVNVNGVEKALEQLDFLKPAVPHPNNTHFVRLQLKVNETGLVDVTDAEIVVRYAANVSRTIQVNETADNGTIVTVPKQEYVTRMRHKTQKLSISVNWFNPRERTNAEWLDSETKLYDIMEHEKQKRESAEAKNNFEGYLFWVKGDGAFYNDELIAKMDPAKLSALRDAVNKAELWLEEGRGSTDTCTRAEYEKEHQMLKKLVNEATGVLDAAAADVGANSTAADINGSSVEPQPPSEADDAEGNSSQQGTNSENHDGTGDGEDDDDDPGDL